MPGFIHDDVREAIKKDFERIGVVNQLVIEVGADTISIYLAKDGEKLIRVDTVRNFAGDTITLELPKEIPFTFS